jgi:uncharacterized protein DUF3592
MGYTLAQGPTSPGRRGISKRTGMAILVGAAGISLVMGIADLRTSQRLDSDGQVTSARVLGKHIERRRSSRQNLLDIEYRTAAGEVVGAQHDVASALHDRVKVGDTITVRYLASDPDVHALGSRARLDTLKLWMAGGWLLLAGVYLLFGK